MTKMTRQEVIDLYRGLAATASLKGAKFAYAVTRNMQLLRSLISMFKFSDGQIEYEKARLATPEKDLKKLEKKYSEVLKQTEDYLNEEVEVKLYMTPVSHIPEDIDAKLLAPIMPIVEESLTN